MLHSNYLSFTFILGDLQPQNNSAQAAAAPMVSSGNSASTTSMMIFFAVFCTLLLLVILTVITSYTLRKYKRKLAKYLPTYVFDGETVKEKPGESLTIDNPLYGTEPPVIRTGGDNPLYGTQPAVIGTSAIVDSDSQTKSNKSDSNGGHI